jgi:hypothetical protein
MKTSLTIALALAAGFVGGGVSRFWPPAPVHAQVQVPPPAEVRAEKFVLVDQNGVARGVFGFESNARPLLRSQTIMVMSSRHAGTVRDQARLISTLRQRNRTSRPCCLKEWNFRS